jgi:3-deoxy-D-manno-octulosonate 8-phosphate phosphatase (KDO 8-P phosphatase)
MKIKTKGTEGPNLSLASIKWVGFDVDGVMTDGGIYLGAGGEELKRFHSRDGHGLKMLARCGLKVFIVTGRSSPIVDYRAKDLGIEHVFQGARDKLAVWQEFLRREKIAPEECAFAGDDVVDLPILLRCGLSMAPSDACPQVLAAARFISPAPGGHGAVRQMAEFILMGRGLWTEALSHYTG